MSDRTDLAAEAARSTTCAAAARRRPRVRPALSRRVAAAPAGAHGLRRRAPVQVRHGRASSARSRCARSTSTRRRRRRSRAAIGLDRRARGDDLRARRREARARAGRGLPHRLRGRLRQPPRRRGGRPRRGRGARGRRRAWRDGTLPPFIGIRIKPFTAGADARAVLRTLDIFLTTLARRDRRQLPTNFVVTLPKITAPRAGRRCSPTSSTPSSRALGLAPGSAAARVHDRDDAVDPRARAARRTCRASSTRRAAAASPRTSAPTTTPRRCNITAADQRMAHPACDFARHMMQVALAGTGVWLSDGATNILPVAPHRGDRYHAQRGEPRVVHALALHSTHPPLARRTPTTRAGTSTPRSSRPATPRSTRFFLEGLEAASERLRNFVEQGRPGHARRRRLRRRRDRPGPAQLLPARHQLRRDHRRGGARAPASRSTSSAPARSSPSSAAAGPAYSPGSPGGGDGLTTNELEARVF